MNFRIIRAYGLVRLFLFLCNTEGAPTIYRFIGRVRLFSVSLGVPPSITVFIGRVRLFLFLCNTEGVPTIYRFIVQGAENGLTMRFFCVRYRSSPSYMTVQNRRSSYTAAERYSEIVGERLGAPAAGRWSKGFGTSQAPYPTE